MNVDMHGKSITAICFNPFVRHLHGEPNPICAGGNKTLHLSATYHGDHDEFWVIESDDGKEIARHNCKQLSSIIWTAAEIEGGNK